MLAIGTKFLATHRMLAPGSAARSSGSATIVVDEDVDGGPLGVLPRAPAAATIIADEDVDGGPPGGAAGSSDSSHHRSRRRRSTAGPLGVLLGAPAAATIVVDEDVRRRAPLRIFRSIVVCVNFCKKDRGND
jgi:hypothetical protein